MYGILFNADVVYVGIVVAAIGMLGFVVYQSDIRSITTRTLFLFSLVTIAWSIANYLSYHSTTPVATLALTRLLLFFAVFHALSFFQLFLVFPKKEIVFPTWYTRGVLPASVAIALLALTPLVLGGVVSFAGAGVFTLQVNPGIGIFALFIVFCVMGGIFLLTKKYKSAIGIEREQYQYVAIGSIITFWFLITFNFIFPAFLNNNNFGQFGALFILPFVIFTGYAIIKYNLLKIKVIGAEIFAFILTTAVLFQIPSNHGIQIYISIATFFLVLGFGILLVRSVIKEVTAREEIERLVEDLALANDRLRDLDKRKSEFVSIASHQLRSPLTAIKGYSSMMLEGSFGEMEVEMREAVERIFQSSVRLIMIIEDFLTISKIEQGKLTYNFAPVDLVGVVEGIVKDMQTNVIEKGLMLRFDAPSGESSNYMVMADSGKVFQVISNLIDNAVKYTPKGGIVVTIARNDAKNRVILSVADTGVGMTPETKEKLFQKFSRAEDASKVNATGSGLGLYVAQQVMLAHNGRIWAESPGAGKGSTFYIELPGV